LRQHFWFASAVPIGSFTRGALVELEPDDLEQMLELNETLFVEHKSDIGSESAYGMASTVASFANTLGGWLLLGVHEGKPLETPPFWAGDDSLPLVDVIRDRLRGELDPLPAFEARVIGLEEGRVGVVRIYESSDTPHVVISSGSVFVREVAGTTDASAPKQPGARARGQRSYRASQIRSRSQLLELSRRGEAATRRVDELLDPGRSLILIRDGLGLRFDQVTECGWQPSVTEGGSVFVRVAPYTVPTRFRAWATTADGAASALRAAENLAIRHGLANSWEVPHPAGVSVTVPLETGARHQDGAGGGLDATASVAVDGAGIVGARLHLAGPDDARRRRWIDMSDVAKELTLPVAHAAVAILKDGEFLGRARCQVDLVGLSRTLLVQGQGNQDPAFYVPTWHDIVLPTDTEELTTVAELAARALARSAGIPAWDAPLGPH
jgi:hypothetical protein